MSILVLERSGCNKDLQADRFIPAISFVRLARLNEPPTKLEIHDF
jgi:hypothetical protein